MFPVRTHRTHPRLFPFVLTSFLLLVACGGDDGSPTNATNDDPDLVATNVVEIDPRNGLPATWTLSGPRNESGSGYHQFEDMPPGDYTVVWGDVSGWITPATETKTLEPEGSITFEGRYLIDRNDKGTIEIVAGPSEITTAWTLSGPFDSTGTESATLDSVPHGEYTIEWAPVEGWLEPSDATLTLDFDGPILFGGTYVREDAAREGFVAIPGGTFTMGSPPDEPGHESPYEIAHAVTLTTPFLLGTTEVTNGEYAEMAQWAYDNGYCDADEETIFLRNVSALQDELVELDAHHSALSFDEGVFRVDPGMEDVPVVHVSWFGAVAYCDWMSLREGLSTANFDFETNTLQRSDPYELEGYRLPTEAEWEYASRAGSRVAFPNGPITHPECNAADPGAYPLDPNLDAIGWYCGNADGRLHPVGGKNPNRWGLHDMHGNVIEWTTDWIGRGIYEGDAVDPYNPSGGVGPVLRGGNRFSAAEDCRSASRGWSVSISFSEAKGFRVARSIR